MAKVEKARGRRRQHSHSSGWGALRGCLWDAQKHGKNNLASMVLWPDMYMYTCYIYLEIYVSVSSDIHMCIYYISTETTYRVLEPHIHI